MKKFFILLLTLTAVSLSASGQTKSPVARPSAKPAVRAVPATDLPVPTGTVTGRTYTDRGLGFEITFPDTWLIAGDDFIGYMKAKGFDLTPRPPKAADLASQGKVNADFKRLRILLTAYRSLPGTAENGVVRIAAESIRSLNTNRPVTDAVDYVDLMRSQLAAVRMPASFKYSETQAEKLGNNQFAYIDTSQGEVKTRVYVTVRNGYAILFSLDYFLDSDLETFRDFLARANFALT
jgi:hypothetical protein